MRRGRKRKLGKRHPSGDLILERETPRTRAKAMPHRRWLGDKAVDQLAENELGRMVLAGRLAREFALAGEYYAAAWRGYVSTLAGPKRLVGQDYVMFAGGGYDCGGCLGLVDSKFCMCAARRDKWTAAMRALRAAGWPAAITVQQVALNGMECPLERLATLRLGLAALAHHFGLTAKTNSLLGKASSQVSNSLPTSRA